MRLTKDGRTVEIEREEHIAAYLAGGWTAEAEAEPEAEPEVEPEAEAEAKPKSGAKAKAEE